MKIIKKISYVKRKLTKKKPKKKRINKNDNKEIFLLNKIDNYDNKRKIRNPGVDSVRILGMYAIIVHHILHYSKLFEKYRKYKELVLMNISCFWHVSSYALISGYIGYKSHKYSNLLYLWICAFFYSIGIIYYFKYKLKVYNREIKFEYYFPVYYDEFWYFSKYFGMYLFLPVVNKGIVYLTKSELKIVVISLILIYVVFKDIIAPNKDAFEMNRGYSVIWLLIFYLTGAYFGKFKTTYNRIKKFILIAICIFVFYLSTYLCYYFSNYPIDNSKGYLKIKAIRALKNLFVLRISSVPMILQSISIVLLLTEIKYNKYLAKIITFIGPLTFGIYLSHTHPKILSNVLEKLFTKESYNLSLNIVIKLVLIRGLKIFVICLIIDYLRHILFIFLRCRKICIYFERIIYKIF